MDFYAAIDMVKDVTFDYDIKKMYFVCEDGFLIEGTATGMKVFPTTNVITLPSRPGTTFMVTQDNSSNRYMVIPCLQETMEDLLEWQI